MPVFKSEKKHKSTPTLRNPPLLEVVYEVRWEIQVDQKAGRMKDPSYPMMYGRLFEKFKDEFEVVEDLPTVQAHPEAAPYMPRHRMRKDKNGYPLIQVGPGIITINASREYRWSDFKKLIVNVMENVIEMYPSSVMPLNFIKSELRYVNGIDFDLVHDHPLEFLKNQLHMNVGLDDELFEQAAIVDKPNTMALNLAYALEKPLGNLGLAVNLGQFDNKPAFIVQSVIHSFGKLVPNDISSISKWLDEAHGTAETCFQVFCKGKLMEKFSGGL